MSFENVLVSTDGGPERERALEVAASLVKQAGGRITLLHVAEPPLRVPALGAEIGEVLTSGQLDSSARRM